MPQLLTKKQFNSMSADFDMQIKTIIKNKIFQICSSIKNNNGIKVKNPADFYNWYDMKKHIVQNFGDLNRWFRYVHKYGDNAITDLITEGRREINDENCQLDLIAANNDDFYYKTPTVWYSPFIDNMTCNDSLNLSLLSGTINEELKNFIKPLLNFNNHKNFFDEKDRNTKLMYIFNDQGFDLKDIMKVLRKWINNESLSDEEDWVLNYYFNGLYLDNIDAKFYLLVKMNFQDYYNLSIESCFYNYMARFIKNVKNQYADSLMKKRVLPLLEVIEGKSIVIPKENCYIVFQRGKDSKGKYLQNVMKLFRPVVLPISLVSMWSTIDKNTKIDDYTDIKYLYDHHSYDYNY